MQSIEITDKSVQDAAKAAAERLGVPVEALKVTVLEEQKGLFGRTQVRILAEVAEAPAAAPESQPEAPPEPDPTPEPSPSAEETAAGGEQETESAPETEDAGEAAEAEPEVVATEQDAEAFAGVVRELLAAGGFRATVKLKSLTGKYVNLEIEGPDTNHLIGKHGEVLNNLQYLLNTICSRKFQTGVRATLDANNYRQRRESALRQLALRLAEEVRKRGQEAVLEALPAFERRVVHKALEHEPGVTTYSEGEEPDRRVVIAPAD
ncbi:MAG: KH domain-containing protein [Fimbriimonadales bacterium]|nr:KH domain-containing protein [Fimbriimonadales bacterium]